jgi:hypothetical protein
MAHVFVPKRRRGFWAGLAPFITKNGSEVDREQLIVVINQRNKSALCCSCCAVSPKEG